MTQNNGADAINVAEVTVEQWLAAAFAAERAPQRSRAAAAATMARGAAQPIRAFYWWMLGLSMLALVLR